MKGLAFAVEPWANAVDEIREIISEHWEEIALDKETIKLDPDWDAYAKLAENGMLHCVTARDGGKLVGYHLSIIHPHLHYKSSLQCFTDVFYLRKGYRTGMSGYKMLKFFRDSLKERGVQKVYMMTKLALDLGPVLDRLGFKPIERVYSKVL